ncbi:MAG: 5-deoxy-glucuronate isomerase [Chloroflexota bacterium]
MEKSMLVKPNLEKSNYLHVNPESAGWEYLYFSAWKLNAGQSQTFDTKNNEYALIIFGGSCDIQSDKGTWLNIGSRVDVFHGLPTTLYLSRNTKFTITSLTPTLDIGIGWCLAFKDHAPMLISPEQVEVELRGGENASRQINKMIPPGFDCDRLVVVEVYTPSGNWSSYPPHKHDQRKVDDKGNLIEADLEEVYFYKIDKPEGYAYQRIYNDDKSLDQIAIARHNHLVLSPEGYHPVVAAHGYNVYYLNILAGSDQSLASSDDPDFSWIKNTWKETDKRLPLVNIQMNIQYKE